MSNPFKSKNLSPLYFLGFLFALQNALPTFVNSSYLGTLMPAKLLVFVYIAQAVLTIAGFLLLPKILKRFGNFRTATVLILLEIISAGGLIIFYNVIAVSFFMTISLALLAFIAFSFDVFVEGLSADRDTGRIRGTYLTCVNLAWIFAPFLAGWILADSDYRKIYLFVLMLLVIIFIILRLIMSRFKDSPYQDPNLSKTFVQIWQNKDILRIFMANFLLQLFYSWMIIYTPIYLHSNLGFSWGDIGIIFGVMLLPFVLVQFPAGRLADSRLGEKELLSAGFIIMALATITMYFITGKSLLVWALILFGTRVGAAVVEVMCDTYFFKKVDNQNVNLIGFYRMASPLSYIIGSFLILIILNLFHSDIRNLFLVLGLLMLFGLRYSLAIKDTR